MSDVLVIDPSELGELLTTLFGQYGFSAVRAHDAESALEVALERKPRAIVIDADLPDAEGLDIADLLQAELGAHVVFTYAPERAQLGGDAFKTRLLSMGASFAKPFRSLRLIEAVSDLLGHDPVADIEIEVGEPLDLVEEVDEGAPNFDEIILEDVAPSDEAEEQAGEERASAARSLEDEERTQKGLDALTDMFERLKQEPEQQKTTRRAAAPPPSGQGALNPRVLTDLLDAFHQSQASGQIWLRSGSTRRLLRFGGGRLIAARSNVQGESFLAALEGHVGDVLAAKIERTAREQELPGVRVAVQLGVSSEAIEAMVREQLHAVVGGGYTVVEGDHKEVAERALTSSHRVSVAVGDLILRGILRAETDEALVEAAPDDARFAPSPDTAYRLENLDLSDEEARLVVAIDGTKTVADLRVLFTGLEERVQRGLIAGLFRLGLLRFDGWGHAKPKAISFF